MKYVVTGGAGFVGSHLVKLLVKEGHVVTVIDNLHTGKKENLESVIQQITFKKIDIRSYEELGKIMNNIDGVFHQAALTVVQDSFENPQEYYDVNVGGTENIFKLAQKNNFKVVYASSSSVYGHQEKVPIAENAIRNPINPYGQTKLDDEYLVEKYSKLGVKIIGLRYFNIFGEGQTLEYAGVITKFLDKIKQSQSPIIFGDGSQIRDFIYVGDIVMANFLAMKSEVNNLLVNIGTGEPLTILKLAEIFLEISSLELKPIFKNALDGDIQRSQANIELAISSFNWKPKKMLNEWLIETLKK